MRNSRIVLRVSDGEKVSNTVVLRIMAVGLEYKISNNTGLEVIQGEMFILSTNQLAIWTNALKQVVEIRYDVIEPPRFGETPEDALKWENGRLPTRFPKEFLKRSV